MSDILCRWLNTELRLSKPIEPNTFSKDFSNGYLIGEVLHKYQMQEDFSMFMRTNTSDAKVNNFTRVEPTLRLLGVPFDLNTARALMQERQGAAVRLLYQLYILLQKKKKAGITLTAMEIMQPTAPACLHRKEHEIYSDRVTTLLKRDAEIKLQKISQRYEEQAKQMHSRAMVAKLAQEQQMLRLRDDFRLQEREQLHATRQRRNKLMAGIQASMVQMPKPPYKKLRQSPERRQQLQLRREHQAQSVKVEIDQFEKNRKKWIPDFSSSSSSGQSFQVPAQHRGELVLQSNSEYLQGIRQRLAEDAAARQHRELRRRRFLQEQLKAHEAQEEALRDEQLVERLTRQALQERRLAVQLLQMRMQKEVIRGNRLLRERQHQQQRVRDFQEALDREATLAQQVKREHAEETRKEIELHCMITAERAQERYKKHSKSCREVLEQIVDLATKVGEYRLLTGKLIPAKRMREWKELLFSGFPLYEPEAEQPETEPSALTDPVELEKQELLNNQDYEEYTNMTGEWAWTEEAGELQSPPGNNTILGHVVLRLKNIVCPPTAAPPPPPFPQFTLKACLLGKLFSGKTTCLNKIVQAHGIHVLSASEVIEEALVAYQLREAAPDSNIKTSDQSSTPVEAADKKKLSVRARHGAAVEKVLRNGATISDELTVEIVMEAIKRLPADSGWILDGFPMNNAQAQLLESALGGVTESESQDTDKKRKKRRQKNLAIDPNAPKSPPPAAPVLDLIVLLDLSDDRILSRAAQQACQEAALQTGDVPALKTPVSQTTKKPGTQTSAAAALPTRDKSLEKRQIQHRITAFHDTWSKLEMWYGAKQNILVRVDADTEEDVLFSRVESILQEAMKKKAPAEEIVLDSADPEGASLSGLSPSPGLSQGRRTPSKSSRSSTTVDANKRIVSAKGNSSLTLNCPPESVSPCPGSDCWVYVDEPLPLEISEYLSPYWDTVCDSYVSYVKAVMQNLRAERVLIIRHLFNIGEEYKHYIGRPDLKQEFVCQWQKNFNSIPDDMRDDSDTKAELHQRLDDLRERLWDICDTRKEEDLQEKTALMESGWLEDHTAVVINHFTTLMQVEVDRFQDTMYILRDYYLTMLGQALPKLPTEYTCIPLLDVTNLHCSVPEESADHVEDEVKEPKKTKAIHYLPRRLRLPPDLASRKCAVQQDDQSPPSNEKFISEIYDEAIAAIDSLRDLVLHEMHRQEEKERMEKEKRQRSSQPPLPPPPKDKKKAPAKKKAPSPPPEPSPPPAVEENSEEIQKQQLRAKMRKEHKAALEHELHAVKTQVGLVKGRAVVMVDSLTTRAEETFSNMEEWMGARHLAEMSCIDHLTDVVRQNIETGSQLHNELILEGITFYLNADVRMVPSPPPPPRPPPLEKPTNSTLTVAQLESLRQQLSKVAPSGFMSSAEFAVLLQDLISLNMCSNSLPDAWINLSEIQMMEIIAVVAQGSELLDWRRFLLSAALPWPVPTITQLLALQERFRTADRDNTGYVNQEQYLQLELWFPSKLALPVPKDPTEALPYNRLDNLRKFFFQLFAVHSSSPPRLDYASMLQYLAAHPDPAQGFIRTLSIVLGQHLKYPSTNPFVESMPSIEEAAVSPEHKAGKEGEGTPHGSSSNLVGRQGRVSISALLTVISHRATKITEHSRFQLKSQERHTEDLVRIFRDLGYGPEELVPSSVLWQHPLVQEIIEASQHHQLIDIHGVIAQEKERENQSYAAS